MWALFCVVYFSNQSSTGIGIYDTYWWLESLFFFSSSDGRVGTKSKGARKVMDLSSNKAPRGQVLSPMNHLMISRSGLPNHSADYPEFKAEIWTCK